VTRVFPLSSQVTLLVDKDAAIPVLNARTLARSAAFGGAGGDAMELRYMAANADVKVGDELMTSGVDGIYPPGLSVAKVTAVERRAESGFARILLAPSASADGVRHVLVLEPLGQQLPPREPMATPSDSPKQPAKGARR
jgi:rod shape-determining protein MreC